jgi:hypothetical protein
MPVTEDQAEIMHFAGHHRLSPAFRDGVPVLVPPDAPGERCGWAAFFAAIRSRGAVATLDAEDPASFRLVSAGGSGPRPAAGAHAPSSRGVLAEARRFFAALRGKLPPA